MVAAGIQEIDTLQTVTRDVIMRQFDVNALGPVLVVQALLPRLLPGSKVRLSDKVGMPEVQGMRNKESSWVQLSLLVVTVGLPMQVVLIASKMGSIAAVGLTGGEMVGSAAAPPIARMPVQLSVDALCSRHPTR